MDFKLRVRGCDRIDIRGYPDLVAEQVKKYKAQGYEVFDNGPSGDAQEFAVLCANEWMQTVWTDDEDPGKA